MRADAARVGGWVVQESFRRHAARRRHVVAAAPRLGPLGAHVPRLGAARRRGRHPRGQAERFGVRTVRSGAAAVAEAAARADAVIVAVGNDPHLAGPRDRGPPAPAAARRPPSRCGARRARRTRARCSRSCRATRTCSDGAADAATVVWSSHGGQELGHGVVDVLSGDREPSGRLAQGWPATEEQAGDLFDYDTLRQGATYRHQAERAHVRVRSRPHLRDRRVRVGRRSPVPRSTGARARRTGTPGSSRAPTSPVVRAVVRVRNTGDRDAEELVQLYALPPTRLADPDAAPRARRRIAACGSRPARPRRRARVPARPPRGVGRRRAPPRRARRLGARRRAARAAGGLRPRGGPLGVGPPGPRRRCEVTPAAGRRTPTGRSTPAPRAGSPPAS